jgi:hypothetical protein
MPRRQITGLIVITLLLLLFVVVRHFRSLG